VSSAGLAGDPGVGLVMASRDGRAADSVWLAAFKGPDTCRTSRWTGKCCSDMVVSVLQQLCEMAWRAAEAVCRQGRKAPRALSI